MRERPTVGHQHESSVVNRFLRWLVPDRRRSSRQVSPLLVAYLGIIGSSKPYPVGDISATGFFMLTSERWMPGTSMPVSLLRSDLAHLGNNQREFITVQAIVVRNAVNGVGFAFLLADGSEASTEGLSGARWATKAMVADFLEGLLHAESTDQKGLACAS